MSQPLPTVEIDGHRIGLNPAEAGEMVTDVLILRRVVRVGDNGTLEDMLMIDASDQCTGMVQAGMLVAAQTLTNDWGFPDDAEED